MVKGGLIFTKVPYNLTDIPLASLVPNIKAPHQDALRGKMAIKKSDYSKRRQDGIRGFLDSCQSSLIKAQLTRLMQVVFGKGSSDELFVQANVGFVYELHDPKIVFGKLCQDIDVQEWLTDGYASSGQSYLVTGWRTFAHARTVLAMEDRKHKGLKADFPVKEVVKENTGVDLGDVADVSMEVEKGALTVQEEDFTVARESIYCIQYRKIKVDKKKPGESKLDDDPIWKPFNYRGDIDQSAEELTASIDGDQIPDDAEEYELIEAADGHEYYVCRD